MKKEGNLKTVALLALIIAVVGLGIGFAAFTRTLTISSSATVTPSSDTFKVGFSGSNSSLAAGTVVTDGVYATGGSFNAGDLSLSGLKAAFTAPGQTATWKVYAFNSGEYKAFLNNVVLGNITCTPGEGADATKVSEACNHLKLSVKVGETTFESSNPSVSNHALEINTGEEVLVTLSYAVDGARADGDFSVAIGNVELVYDSVD